MTNITEIAFIKCNLNMSNSSCKVLEKIFFWGGGRKLFTFSHLFENW